MKYHDPKFGRVYQPCAGEMLCLSEVKQKINIEEDIEGHDVLTYICPDCGDEHKSKIYGR